MISLPKTLTKVVAWVSAVAIAVAFAVPAGAFQALPNSMIYEFKSQSGTISADGTAHEVTANAGDTVQLSLTVANRSQNPAGRVWYGTSALLSEGPDYPNAHAIGVGTARPFDNVPSWIDSSSFVINNNRFVYYDGAAVNPGDEITLTWDVKISATAANGTYDLYVGLVREFDEWGRQWKNGMILPNPDIFWRFVIGGGTTTPTAGGLTVSIASDTPAPGQIANNANTNFTKITLTPSAGATVDITSVYVTRSGLSTDSAVQNVKLVRVSDGVQVGNTAGGFNANHKAQIFFSPALSISSSTDFYIRAGIVTSTTTAPAGNTVALGIADNADIVSNATSVSGAPVTGNQMTIVNITVGTITLAEYGSVPDSTPDVGDTDVTLNTFQLTAGSVEDIIVEQITVLKAGTASSTDTNNIELVNETAGTTVATVAAWNAENKAVFNFSPPLTIAKGNTVLFTVRIDIISGSGLTVNADIVDGSDGLVIAKGSLYGYYINPTVSGSWTGTPTASQTINSGALVISKASTTAPTGNVAEADDQDLGTFTFEARGEDVLISALHIDLVVGQVAGTPDATDVTNARLFDESGNIVVGPLDGDTTDTGTGDAELDFKTSFIVPVGVHDYTLKVRIGTDFADTDTIVAGISANGDITARTIRTNTTLVAGTTILGAPVTLNTMTVRGVALAAVTLDTPAQQSITLGIQDHIFMTGVFNASGSGEDVRVTAAPFQVATTNQADPDALVNMEIWADLTPGNSERGDKYETKITNTEQPSGSNSAASTVDYTWTFTTPLTVVKDSFIEIAFVGDLISGVFTAAGSNDTFTVSFDGDGTPKVSASGVNTGSDPSTTPTGSGKSRTVEAAGSVTITVDSSSPLSTLLVGGSTGQTIAVYRAAASAREDVELDQVVVTNESTGDENTGTWYLYSNRDGAGNLVTPFVAATSPNGTTMTFNIADGTVKIPADKHALFTIKTDILTVDGTTVVNGDKVDTKIADLTAAGATGTDTDFDFTGLASGEQVPGTGTDDITNADHYIYESFPTITLAPNSPSGNLLPKANDTVAIFRITADAAEDITFDSDDSNQLIITVDTYATTYNEGASSAVSLKNKTSGIDLDTAQNVDLGSTAASKSTEVTFDFDKTSIDPILTIPAGGYQDIAVVINTTLFNTAGDSIVVWLNDGSTNAFKWSIDSGTAADTTAISFRGDIYAHTLVKAG